MTPCELKTQLLGKYSSDRTISFLSAAEWNVNNSTLYTHSNHSSDMNLYTQSNHSSVMNTGVSSLLGELDANGKLFTEKNVHEWGE